MSRKATHLMLCFGLLISLGIMGGSCDKSDSGTAKTQSKKLEVKIDWVPSPEYYGFYYAKAKKIYQKAGLDVNILRGTGAPAVAKELAVGTIYAGTTTSDNLLREVAEGASFYSVTPLLAFNPSVVASLRTNPVTRIEDLRGKTLGVNKQSSVYQQLLWTLGKKNIPSDAFKEYPIGWGGAVELEAGTVDAILAYTTNAVVDMEKKGVKTSEVFLGNDGVISYGVVLVVAAESRLRDAGLSLSDARAFVRATVEGYRQGCKDIEGTVKVLLDVDPTLDRDKLALAIQKIGRLNAQTRYNQTDLDKWCEDKSITEAARERTLRLYEVMKP